MASRRWWRVFRGGMLALYKSWGWRPPNTILRRLSDELVTLVAALAIFLMVVTPISFVILESSIQVNTQIHSPIDIVTVNVNDAVKIGDYINSSVKPDDLVIASPALAWMFRCNVAEFQQTLAASGLESLNYQIAIPPDRFSYPVELSYARFVVVDPIWRNWAIKEIPGMKKLYSDIEAWPKTMTVGEIDVYENPKYP